MATIQDFIQLISALRNPKTGCPWDIKQTYQSMIPCIMEESYEVIDAIWQNNKENLKEELGDLLLQVVFLSQLATEDNDFTFQDVLDDVYHKIIYRHPHVFGENKVDNAEQALASWNEMKEVERQNKGLDSILDNIPLAFPALMRAEKLQKRCAKVGFDWDRLDLVIDKVEEELQEVKYELNQPQININKVEEELGDLLFSMVNLTRHLNVQAEQALIKANNKFEHRFKLVEQELMKQGKTFYETSLAEMDMIWNKIKTLDLK